MRHNLFIGWGIPLAMLFAFYSCSNEMDSDFESDEEAVNLKLSTDSILTRSNPWEEESALEWAEDWEGTGPYSPWEPNEFEFVKSMSGDDYIYYACFNWGAGFPEGGIDIALQYYLQIQWSYTDDFYAVWSYINMPNNKYGLVKVLAGGSLEKISAYAFPYEVMGKALYLRMRTVHEDFIGATPIPGIESQYKFDRSLFSRWSSPISIGYTYINYWGYGRPQPTIKDIDDEEKIVIDKTSFIVRVYLPFNTNKYNYSYVMYNHSSTYVQSLGGALNHGNEGMGIGTNIGPKGGEIEVIASRTNKLTGDIVYETVFQNYSAYERDVDIYISENAFGYD